MIVRTLKLADFRNAVFTQWQPSPFVNVIYGKNAQGKTNLLEALWLFTGGKSFRGAKDTELVRMGAERARLLCEFIAEGRDQTAEISIERRRKASLNGIALSSPTKLTGIFGAVVFSPDSLQMIKGSPDGRRRFMDAALCQVKPAYIRLYTQYQQILQQRNALLKEWARYPDDEQLAAWTEKLAECATEMVLSRREYVKKLRPHAEAFYQGLCGGSESFSVAYEPEKTVYEQSREQIAAYWRAELTAARRADIGAGFSTVGPHREDLTVSVEGLSARSFASQGQQRSAVLALKMAEAAVLYETTGERPLILLDDVMSEMDDGRQQYLMNHLDGWQVFITCCDPSALSRLADGAVFEMRGGELISAVK